MKAAKRAEEKEILGSNIVGGLLKRIRDKKVNDVSAWSDWDNWDQHERSRVMPVPRSEDTKHTEK